MTLRAVNGVKRAECQVRGIPLHLARRKPGPLDAAEQRPCLTSVNGNAPALGGFPVNLPLRRAILKVLC